MTIKLHCTSILHLNLSRMLIPFIFAVVSVHWMKKRQWKKEMKSNRDMMTWRRNLLNLLVLLYCYIIFTTTFHVDWVIFNVSKYMYSLLVQTPEIYMCNRKIFYIVTTFRQLMVYMQGAKKLSQLYSLPFGQAVASMYQDEQDWLQFFCNLNSLINFTCLLCKLKTEFTDPVAKCTSPRLSYHISLHAAYM